MKITKKLITFIVVIIMMVTTIMAVSAKEILKQQVIDEKIRTFINTEKIEMMSNYTENGTKIYKIHDIINDKYYKLALDENDNIDWYDNVMKKETSKIDIELQENIDKMSDSDKISVAVELSFDYEKVEQELITKNSKYFTRDGLKENLTTEQTDIAKAIKTEYIKEQITKNNILDKKYEIIYNSEYSPYMFLKVTKDQIEKLVADEKIQFIGALPEEPAILSNTEINMAAATVAINNNPITSTRINQVKSAGFNGSGIKIGQIELSNPNTANSTLSGKTIVKRTANCQTDAASIAHATEVAGIMIGSNGIATASSLYSSCAYWSEDFGPAIDWLVSQNVNVVNMSAGYPGGTYQIYDRYIDAISYMHNILFVSAAGNSSTPQNTVVSPALALNGITVGNISYNGSNYVDAINSTRYPESCYNTAGFKSQASKPDISAPGTNVNYTNSADGLWYGTSFSAPLVSGLSALVMQSTPSAKGNVKLMKAALSVTAMQMSNYPHNKYGTDYINYNNEVGIGMLDGLGTYNLLRWGQYHSATLNLGSAADYTYNKSLNGNITLKVALTWLKPNTATNYNNIENYGSDIPTDMDLYIIAPNGVTSAISYSATSNTEYLQFTTSQGTGTYKFRAVFYATNGNPITIPFTLAWW